MRALLGATFVLRLSTCHYAAVVPGAGWRGMVRFASLYLLRTALFVPSTNRDAGNGGRGAKKKKNDAVG